MALQADGKIVTAGSARIDDRYHFAVAATTPMAQWTPPLAAGGSSSPRSATAQPSRCVAGRWTHRRRRLWRPGIQTRSYNSDGHPDASFGTGGTVSTAFDGGASEVFGVAVQPDGKVVAAGRAVVTPAAGSPHEGLPWLGIWQTDRRWFRRWAVLRARGCAVALSGSASDPDSNTVTQTWSIASQSVVDAGTTCSFGDPGAAGHDGAMHR